MFHDVFFLEKTDSPMQSCLCTTRGSLRPRVTTPSRCVTQIHAYFHLITRILMARLFPYRNGVNARISFGHRRRATLCSINGDDKEDASNGIGSRASSGSDPRAGGSSHRRGTSCAVPRSSPARKSRRRKSRRQLTLLTTRAGSHANGERGVAGQTDGA